MKRCTYLQYAIVKAQTAETFTESLNMKLLELCDNAPSVSFSDSDPLCAYISYTEYKESPENLKDEYELTGARITCNDCPMFTPEMKSNGTVDERKKYGHCKYAEFRKTAKTSSACDTFYQMLKDGELVICKHEEE